MEAVYEWFTWTKDWSFTWKLVYGAMMIVSGVSSPVRAGGPSPGRWPSRAGWVPSPRARRSGSAALSDEAAATATMTRPVATPGTSSSTA